MVELNNKTLESRPATFIVDQDEVVGNLYYFALTGAGKPPYRTQRHVNAILDIADDGTLAGVELIDNMPPPPAAIPAPDRLVERLRQDANQLEMMSENAKFVADGVVRVKDPSTLLDDLHKAATALQSQAALIERLTRERVVALENYTRAWNEKDAQRRSAEQHIQKLTAENKRLDTNIVRLTGNPIDHRYWEGRYRDEKAENERLREALTDLIDYVESNECHHEGVHRGGAIWTICDECGAKWADDKGGFQPYKEPPELTAARSALETQEGGK